MITFNVEQHLKELNERFTKTIKGFGSNNRKGSPRYNHEVDFSYSIDELVNAPFYLQGKIFETISQFIDSLIDSLKSTTP